MKMRARRRYTASSRNRLLDARFASLQIRVKYQPWALRLLPLFGVPIVNPMGVVQISSIA